MSRARGFWASVPGTVVPFRGRASAGPVVNCKYTLAPVFAAPGVTRGCVHEYSWWHCRRASLALYRLAAVGHCVSCLGWRLLPSGTWPCSCSASGCLVPGSHWGVAVLRVGDLRWRWWLLAFGGVGDLAAPASSRRALNCRTNRSGRFGPDLPWSRPGYLPPFIK